MKHFLIKHAKLIIVLFYLATRLINLTLLPVFADEAIYIHWAHAAIREPDKYLFLSMLDGKPPLHVFALIPFVTVFSDPLLGGRLLSVICGLVTMLVIGKIIKVMGGKRIAQLIGMAIVVVTPYWFFIQRMALAESMFVMFFALAFLYAMKFIHTKKVVYSVLFGIALGATLWIKTNALFFYPVFMMIPLLFSFPKKQHIKLFIKEYMFYGCGLALSMVLFLTLKFSPLFPSLFSRSEDYTFQISELIAGQWEYVLLVSIPRICVWLLLYMTPFFPFFLFMYKKQSWKYILLSVIYMAPLIVLGKTLTSRYFYPILVPLSVAFAVSITYALEHTKDLKTVKKVLGLFVLACIAYMSISIIDPNRMPFTREDRVQYLTDWSSGHGILEASQYFKSRISEIEKQGGKLPIYVATEGFFGTLPDGLSIYFNDKSMSGKIEIHGIGQPVNDLPKELIEKSKTQEVYLLVNSHRFFYKDVSHFDVIASYPRPYDGPMLLLLKIK